MKCLVAGAGAVGAITAACLARAGHEVTVVDEWHQNVMAIRRDGIRVETTTGPLSVSVRALYVDEFVGLDERFEVACLAVKSYDTCWMSRVVEQRIGPSGFVVSTQNGMNENELARVVGASRTVGCVVHMSGGMFEPGVVARYTNPAWPTFSIGELDGQVTSRLELLGEVLSCVGPTRITTNIWGALWSKLALNCMTNGLAGVTGLSTAELWTNDSMIDPMLRLGAEVALVAMASGRTMEAIRPAGAPAAFSPSLLVAAAQGDTAARAECFRLVKGAGAARQGRFEGKASLLQDLIRGRRTEIDYLNGYVSRQGRKAGVPTPVNDTLTAIVKRIEGQAVRPNLSAASELLQSQIGK